MVLASARMRHLLLTFLFSILCRYCSSLKSAIVVGAGPTGLATALVLAKRHGYQVIILEAAERTDVYDPTKAYPFLIRERGQKMTQMFPDIQGALEEQGIATEGNTKMVVIPADPSEILDTEPKQIPAFRPAGRNFWLRRHEFIRILLEAASKEENITIINGATCKSVAALSADDGSLVEVCTEQVDERGEPVDRNYTTTLLVAADGMKSKVRESLATPPSPFPEWKNSRPQGFKIKRWFSPSSGLRFKTLHINSAAQVPVGDGTMYDIPFNTQTFFTIRSKFTSPRNSISLGLLPSKKAPTRTFNVFRLPNHDIWKIRDGKELREWFARAFPRFDFSAESSLVDQNEFDRFAQTEGLSLPPCQYCPELYVASPCGKAAVILIGDVVHTFPPDIGEGVNSGLEDVVTLDDVLFKHESIGKVAEEYARQRGPESKALVKIARFGAPFQYGQFGGLLTVKKVFWTANFFGRVMLNKVTRGLTPMPVFVQVADPETKYSTAVRQADMLTAALWTILGSLLLASSGILSKVKSLIF